MIDITRRILLITAVTSGLVVHFNDYKQKKNLSTVPVLMVGKNGLPDGIQVPFEKAVPVLPATFRGKIQMATIRLIADYPWYQFVIDGENCPRYVSAISGKEGPNEDEIYADEIARYFLDRNGLKQVQLLTRFNEEYQPINRVLPVYQFDADDLERNRVYVSTAAGKVIFHINNGNTKTVLAWAK